MEGGSRLEPVRRRTDPNPEFAAPPMRGCKLQNYPTQPTPLIYDIVINSNVCAHDNKVDEGVSAYPPKSMSKPGSNGTVARPISREGGGGPQVTCSQQCLPLCDRRGKPPTTRPTHEGRRDTAADCVSMCFDPQGRIHTRQTRKGEGEAASGLNQSWRGQRPPYPRAHTAEMLLCRREFNGPVANPCYLPRPRTRY